MEGLIFLVGILFKCFFLRLMFHINKGCYNQIIFIRLSLIIEEFKSKMIIKGLSNLIFLSAFIGECRPFCMKTEENLFDPGSINTWKSCFLLSYALNLSLTYLSLSIYHYSEALLDHFQNFYFGRTRPFEHSISSHYHLKYCQLFGRKICCLELLSVQENEFAEMTSEFDSGWPFCEESVNFPFFQVLDFFRLHIS